MSRGVLSLGDGSGERGAEPLPQKIFRFFGVKMTCFGAFWHYFE